MKKINLLLNDLHCGFTMEKNVMCGELYSEIFIKTCSFGWHDTIYPYSFNRPYGFETYIFFFTLTGKGIVKCRNNKYVADENKVIILPPNESHTYYTEKGNKWEFYWIHVYIDNAENFINHIIEKRGLCFEIHDIRHLCNYIDSMLISTQLGIDYDIFISRKLSEIIYDLFDSAIIKYNCKPINNDFVKSVIIYIEQHYMFQISIHDISNKIFMSPCHIIRNFKTHTGYTPYAYLKKYRLLKAQEFLVSTNFTIKEIASMVGYNSASHFIAEFKAEKLLTPNGMRQKTNFRIP